MTATAKKQKLETAPEPELELELPPPIEAVKDAEPELDTVGIPFRAVTFTLPKQMDEWDVEACLAMNEGNYILAAKLLLGPRQWMQLMALGDKRKDIREFLTLFADVVDKECIS